MQEKKVKTHAYILSGAYAYHPGKYLGGFFTTRIDEEPVILKHFTIGMRVYLKRKKRGQ